MVMMLHIAFKLFAFLSKLCLMLSPILCFLKPKPKPFSFVSLGNVCCKYKVVVGMLGNTIVVVVKDRENFC